MRFGTEKQYGHVALVGCDLLAGSLEGAASQKVQSGMEMALSDPDILSLLCYFLGPTRSLPSTACVARRFRNAVLGMLLPLDLASRSQTAVFLCSRLPNLSVTAARRVYDCTRRRDRRFFDRSIPGAER